MLVCALLLVLLGTVFAEQPPGDLAISSHADRTAVTIGDIIQYTLSVEWAESIQVEPPSLAANLGNFEIRDYQTIGPRPSGEGRLKISTTYQIAVYEAGEYTIPGVPINYIDRQKQPKTVNSEPIDIMVKSMDPDLSGTIRDIRSPASIPIDWRPFIIGGAIALAVLLAALIGWIIWRQRKAGRLRKQAFGFERPAHQWALEALDKLLAAGYLDEGLIKQYYIEVSEILRGYLQRRFLFNAPEQTTSEIMTEALNLPLTADQRDKLRWFLEMADLVKFAKYLPQSGTHPKMIETARDLIHATEIKHAPLAPAQRLEKADTENGKTETQNNSGDSAGKTADRAMESDSPRQEDKA